MLLRSVLAGLSKSLPTEASELRVPRKRLGEALRELGRVDEALALHRQGLKIERAQFPDGAHLSIAASRYQLAQDLLATGRAQALGEAREHIDAAVQFLEASDPQAPRLTDFLLVRAEVAMRQRDAQQAQSDLARVAEAIAREGSPRQGAHWERLAGRRLAAVGSSR